MTTQLNPPIPLWTPGGYAQAHLVIDYGMDQELQWVTFLVASGECRTYLNKDIRLVDNETMGRKRSDEPCKHPASKIQSLLDGTATCNACGMRSD